MKSRWEAKVLEEVSAINYGYTESASSEAIGPRFLRITDIQDDRVDWETVPYCKIESADITKYLLKSGDIVFARTGATTGKSYLVTDPPEAVFASYLIRLRLLDIKLLLPEFVYLFFQTAGYWRSIKDGSSGSAQGGFNATKLGALSIPVPPLSEQRRIVDVLDAAFADIATARANAEKNLQNARALFESHLQSVFTQRGEGWVEKSLGDLCDFLNGFAFKSNDAVAESQTQLVRMGNLYGSQLDLDRNPVFYPNSFATEHSRYVLEEGDIIMSLTGTTGKEDYGFAVRIPSCGRTLLMNQRIMKFVAIRHDLVDDGYLLHYLRSRCFLDVLYASANGTRQANLSSVIMKLLSVPLRSLKDQNTIAATLDDLRAETQHLESIYQQKLTALDELKKSLLHQAFSGQL
jgi:type I restriction enzyme S subunit